MVDQLWLWVLTVSDGMPDIVLTCFPPIGGLDGQYSEEHPDLYNETDVLERIKGFLRTEPSLIRSAYDLAGVIVAVCSRNYLDPSTTLNINVKGKDAEVQFADIYESAIGNIVRLLTISICMLLSY